MMMDHDRTCYPFVWFELDGWWFKAFDECFGPYEQPAEALHNLRLLQQLSRQLHQALNSRQQIS